MFFLFFFFFFFNDTATTEIYTLSLHDALPIPTGLEPGVALNLDGAVRHAAPDAVEPIAGVLDADELRVARPDAEGVADGDPRARRLQLDAGDFRGAFPGQPMRHQGRQVEPLVGPHVQGEHQRRHGSKSPR